MSSEFYFHKPSAHIWRTMPLYQKIRYYGRHLTRAYAPYVDKLQAKEHAQRLCPDIAIPQIIKIFQDGQDIQSADLISHTLFKATHGCGWNVRINPHISASFLNAKRRQWSRVYSRNERQYTFLTPRFFLEEEIPNIVDIKVMCIYGRPIFILIEQESTSFYLDTKWTFVFQAHNPATHIRLNNPSLPPRPPDLERVLSYAQTLSASFECVRIDFYIGKDQKIYFSEFTFTHAGGHRRLDMELERYFGNFWS